MPDICDLILGDHQVFRVRFAELDTRRDADPPALSALWHPLAEMLERHAAAEEDLFYPSLLREGVQALEETTDAISDHNAIRDAVRDARRFEAGSEPWWGAVTRAREENSSHMGEEERGALADFRAHAGSELRDELGTRWVGFGNDHAGGRDLDRADQDPGTYIDRAER